MLKPKYDIELLGKAAHEVARLVPGSRLFGWLTSSLAVPMGWAALALRRNQDPLLVPPGGCCEREEAQEVLFVRITPVECTVQDVDLQSSDGHAFTGLLRVPVRVLADPGELAAFRRTLLGSSEVLAVAGLQRYLQWQMRRVLAELAGRCTAAELLSGLDPAAVRQAVIDRLGTACLAAGLALDGQPSAQFESDSFREHCRQRTQLEQQRHQAQVRTQINEAIASAQREHLSHLTGMLEQMRSCARDGLTSMTDLLRTFSENDRGQMYAALWHLCQPVQKSQAIAAVSGQELLLFDPQELPRLERRVRLPAMLGALRSVTVDAESRESGVLLVGAATGVHVVDMETLSVRESLPASGRGLVRGGINRAAMSKDRIYASHSEIGLLSWPREGPANREAQPFRPDTTAGAGTVRGVQVADGSLWWTADQTLWSLSLDSSAALPRCYSGSRSVLTAVAVGAGTTYAGNEDGQILAWAVEDPVSPRTVRSATGSPVDSMAVLETAGVTHLVVADRTRGLTAGVVGDGYTRRFECGSRVVRRAAVAADLLLAMNDNRDLLLAWNPRQPSEPYATVIIPHLTGSSIQDIALVPVQDPDDTFPA